MVAIENLITLPQFQTRRAWLIGFWLSINILGGVVLVASISPLLTPLWFGVSMLCFLFLASSGFLRPYALAKPYRAWNKAYRYLAWGARLYLTAIIFYTMFIPVGKVKVLTSDAKEFGAPSGWRPRKTNAPDQYFSQYDGTGVPSRRQGWIFEYISWAKGSSHWWAVCLLPFLILISLLKEDQKKGVPSDTYTLF